MKPAWSAGASFSLKSRKLKENTAPANGATGAASLAGAVACGANTSAMAVAPPAPTAHWPAAASSELSGQSAAAMVTSASDAWKVIGDGGGGDDLMDDDDLLDDVELREGADAAAAGIQAVVHNLGFMMIGMMVYGLWFMVDSLWSMVYGLWFMVYSLWLIVYSLWSMVYGLWFMVYSQ